MMRGCGLMFCCFILSACDDIYNLSTGKQEPVLQCDNVLLSDGFDFPVGAPDAVGYYDAQPFLTNTHLGSDWNGNGGQNTDFGDAVSVVSHGCVTTAEDFGGGWGNVVRVVHRTTDGCVESIYAHLSEIKVQPGQCIQRGHLIGNIGTANGLYWAHLHLEIRQGAAPLGGGYGKATVHRNPTRFILTHRPKKN